MPHTLLKNPALPDRGLLGTRYDRLARNTIDYWMLPQDPGLRTADIQHGFETAAVLPEASLQLYLHIPFCAQHCRFCAFSGANSLSFSLADRYATLLSWQIRDQLERSRICGAPIKSIHIGGGSPDLLHEHIGRVLGTIRDLPGISDQTEISVEITLSTTTPEFIEELVKYNVTKVSFGIQTLDPELRVLLRQPRRLHHLPRVLAMLKGRIPVVNADLITCLPGQSLNRVEKDLRILMTHPAINSISSYLLTPGASPSMMAGLASGDLPPQAPPKEQALMRLNTYSAFLREGWQRRGTNTYVSPDGMPGSVLEQISGNECIGQNHYEGFLIAAGASSITSVPGTRLEQTSELLPWCTAVEAGDLPLSLPNCSLVHQKDTALWVFPLRFEGLPHRAFQQMIQEDALSAEQVETFGALENEGLITRGRNGFDLTILGEVFMGHVVRDLKKAEGKKAVDEYIREGEVLGQEIIAGRLKDQNPVNNRQLLPSGGKTSTG